MNGDGIVGIGDTTALIDLLLNGGDGHRSDEWNAADVDSDEFLTIKDVTALIDLMLSSN